MIRLARAPVALRLVVLAALLLGGCRDGGGLGKTAPAPLVEVPEPMLDAVEPSVREQIHEAAASIKASANTAGSAASWGLLARTYHAYDFLEAAEAAYTNARRLDPESFRWAYLQGVLLEELGLKNEAIEALDAALALRPSDVTARVRRASIRRDLGQTPLAQEELEAVLAERDDIALAHCLLGQIAADAGEWQQAADRFERVLELQPQASRVRYPLSRAYARLGRQDDATAQAEASGSGDVSLADPLMAELSQLERGAAAFVRQGAKRQIAGDWQAAVAAYREAVAADPQHVEARMSLGGALAELGDHVGAEAELRRAVEIDPEQALAWYNLAGVLRAQGRMDEALDAYDQAIRRSPDDDRFQLARAQTQLDAGRVDEARSAYEALAADGSIEAEFALARLDASAGRGTEAVGRTEALLGRDLTAGQRRLAHLLLADWNARSGDTGDVGAALDHYQQVIDSFEGADGPGETDPTARERLASAHFGRANLLGALGRLKEASEGYDRATELEPSLAEAWLGGATAAALSGDWSGARRRLEAGLQATQDPARRVDLRHTLARLLATAPDPEIRDGELALELARTALADGGPVDYAETVGMALAEVGRWQEAVDWQQRVINQLESAGQTQRARSARALLEQYRDRRPVRQGS